jgi:hypothetical protein
LFNFHDDAMQRMQPFVCAIEALSYSSITLACSAVSAGTAIGIVNACEVHLKIRQRDAEQEISASLRT